MLDLLNNKGKTVKFPSNFNPKELEKEINTWISEINSYDPSLCDNCLKTMKGKVLKIEKWKKLVNIAIYMHLKIQKGNAHLIWEMH